MNKVKFVRKQGMNHIMIKSQKGQQLSDWEIHAINNNKVNGMLYMDVIQKGNAFTLAYNVTGFITFEEYLQRPMNKEVFARVLANILDNLNSLKEANINFAMLLLDFKYVMVNPSTESIFFACVPIQNIQNVSTLREFLLNIIQYCEFVPGEDRSYVKEYITILNNGINFSEFDLEQYVNKLNGVKKEIKTRTCPQCGSVVKTESNFCPYCSVKLRGNTGDMKGKIYDPTDNEVAATNDKEINVDETPETSEKSRTQDLSDSTTVLGDGSGGTMVLGSDEVDEPTYPFIIRENNQEKISLKKDSFRIGRDERVCDYAIPDNKAISHKHIDIVSKNGHYYVIDLKSTNKTYVDNRVIEPQQEVEIFPGTKIKMGNEEIVFCID